ncbi:T9SS sorting signal type C domain-containing protein [Flavobacterium sp. Sd200]|uniref:T9SS sorting signal type C domain-containing protein n=1 Tax=Flavobacterium sp. Sd200 TaxID=2692211 RepID=UPI00136B4B56|nr:T9SS sorting signal type C domain-containing protein [Flavobacterium sp. Sd200]MXN91120.1 T9SS sorting signal type C domain-containing protein [Flavobacterium sp. Sd200]
MKIKITLRIYLLALLFMPISISMAAAEINDFWRNVATLAPSSTIISQPQSVNVCHGVTAQFTVVLNLTGQQQPIYIWRKNGEAIFDDGNVSGTATPTLTITNVSESDAAAYTCFIIDGSGSVLSDTAYLNTAITSENGSVTCQASPTVISVEAIGNNPQYQWYYNGTNNSNTGGTLIEGENQSVYFPSVDELGTKYYYAVVYPDGFECAAITSGPIAVSVGNTSAGEVSRNQIVCPNGSAAVSISGSFGAVQWQQSSDGINNWADVTAGIGGDTPNYTTPSLATSMYYRARVGNLTCGVAYSDTVAVTVTQTYTWTGTVSTDWNNVNNWACSRIPTLNEDVLIPSEPGNQPAVVSGVAQAKTLTVEDGASLTIETGSTLRTASSIVVGATGVLTVQHNASLMQDNSDANTGSITVIKNSNPLYRLDYTMWSSPVSGQQLQSFSPQTVAGRFYEYRYDYDTNMQAYAEQYFQVDPYTNFEAAKTYLVRMPNSHSTPGYNTGEQSIVFEGRFKGIPNNGTYQREASLNGNRYTAIGNPYPSPISVEEFFDQNSLVLEEDTALYLWRKRNDSTATSYATLTKAGCVANDAVGGGDEQVDFYTGETSAWTISQGQGFIVQTMQAPSTPNIIFTNSMRRPASTTGGQGFFRTAQPSVSRLWLNLKGNQAFSQTAIAYMDGATNGIDYGYDGKRMNQGNTIALYTLAEEAELAIQARPSFSSSDVVPLGFNAAQAGRYTISLDHTEGVFNTGQAIYLKDNVLNSLTLLNEDYNFTTEAGTFNNRFEIIYTGQQALNINTGSVNPDTIIVYKEGGAINISSGTALMSGVKVFDIHGRALYTKNSINATETAVSGLQVQQQVLIVEIDTVNGKISKKIVF